jgi:hypothetical protein
MEENDFSSTVSFYFNAIQILCRKKLSEISLPHKFLFHSADDQNIVLCGFLHLDNEIKCINHSKFVFSSPFEGRIKFKVKAQDLKITLSYTTTTDNEELRDEPLRIFINDREIAKLDMEKQELRKISFNIPKEDIKNNTVVLVFKLNSGKPITLRGGDFYEAAFGIKEIEVESAHYHFTNL